MRVGGASERGSWAAAAVPARGIGRRREPRRRRGRPRARRGRPRRTPTRAPEQSAPSLFSPCLVSLGLLSSAICSFFGCALHPHRNCNCQVSESCVAELGGDPAEPIRADHLPPPLPRPPDSHSRAALASSSVHSPTPSNLHLTVRPHPAAQLSPPARTGSDNLRPTPQPTRTHPFVPKAKSARPAVSLFVPSTSIPQQIRTATSSRRRSALHHHGCALEL